MRGPKRHADVRRPTTRWCVRRRQRRDRPRRADRGPAARRCGRGTPWTFCGVGDVVDHRHVVEQSRVLEQHGDAAAMCWQPRRIVTSDGGSCPRSSASPAMARRSDDLPAPEAPIAAHRVPGAIVIDTSRSTARSAAEDGDVVHLDGGHRAISSCQRRSIPGTRAAGSSTSDVPNWSSRWGEDFAAVNDGGRRSESAEVEHGGYADLVELRCLQPGRQHQVGHHLSAFAARRVRRDRQEAHVLQRSGGEHVRPHRVGEAAARRRRSRRSSGCSSWPGPPRRR